MKASLGVCCSLLLCAPLVAAPAGAPAADPKSPQYQSKGEQDRSYEFPGTGEKIAYHLYVPTKWTPSLRLPLVIVTHGAGQPSTAPFQRPVADPTLAKTAEERGYIVAAVTGYHANATGVGGWNVPYKMVVAPRPAQAAGAGASAGGGGAPGGGGEQPAPAPPAAQDFERAEQDVLFVTDLVAKEYNADPRRIYLMGNSSGGSAVWAYAARYPQRWAAISPSAAPLEDASFPYEKLKKVPVLVVHGDKDTVMVFDASKAMVDHAKAKGVDATWLPVMGGAHVDAWARPEVIKQIFDFFDAHRKMPSLGRAAEGCHLPVLSPGWQMVSVQSSGLDRKVRLYVPATAITRSDLPLVFDLHGSGGNGRSQALHSGLATQADRHGFLLANPDGGIADPSDPTERFYWHIPGVPLVGSVPTPANAPDEVQFFREAIRAIGQTACIDSHRVYVTGFSGGARMASWLACELADRIAAIAPVAGLRAGVPRAGDFRRPETKTCTPLRAVPIITFHGVHDPTNRYDGDGESRWGYGVPSALQRWAGLDGCQAAPSEQKVSSHVTKVSYPGCRESAELILYRTDAPVEHGGGHVWPHPTNASSQGAVSDVETVDQLDASDLIWEFFSRHRS